MITTSEFSHREVAAIIDKIRSELEGRGLGAACAVVDSYGELIAFFTTDGCALPSVKIAVSKAFTAAREKMSSKQVGKNSVKGNYPMTNYGDLAYVKLGRRCAHHSKWKRPSVLLA